GASRQALCVTHLPQVAAQGHAHYRVSKAEREGMTQSAVQRLDAAAREEELARMLGGVEVGKEARAAARRLLRDASSSCRTGPASGPRSRSRAGQRSRAAGARSRRCGTR